MWVKSNTARKCSIFMKCPFPSPWLLTIIYIITSGFLHAKCLGTHETQMLQPTFIIFTTLNVPPSSKPFTTLFLHFQGRNLWFCLTETLSSRVLSFAYHYCGLVISLPTLLFPKGVLPHSHPIVHLWRSLPSGDFQTHFHYTTSNSSHKDFSFQSPCAANWKR